jgi:hypothetical protein
LLPAGAGVVPGAQVFSKELLSDKDIGDLTAVKTHSTAEAVDLLEVKEKGTE